MDKHLVVSVFLHSVLHSPTFKTGWPNCFKSAHICAKCNVYLFSPNATVCTEQTSIRVLCECEMINVSINNAT